MKLVWPEIPLKRSKVRAWLLLALLALTLRPDPAYAHGYLIRAIPEDRAVLERPPTRLQYWFSEDLEPGFSSLHLRDYTGQIIATGGVSTDNTAALALRVPPDLPDGAYIVELRPAFASDGHVYSESRVFFVGEEVGDIAGRSADARALPLEVAWRTITLAAILLLFGLFTLYSGVLIPAWGSARYPAGWLPPRVMRRLAWIIGLALLVAFAGSGLALIQQTMVFFNVSFSAALNPDLWSVVRIGSRFGDVWNARMVFLMIVAAMFAASVWLRETNPRTVRPFWTASAWVMALVIGTFSVVSHAAGSQVLPWVGVLIDWLHGVSVGVWVGGLSALVLVLPTALRPYASEERRLALLAALRRFSRVAVGGLLIVISSGIYSSTNWIATPQDLTETRFGGALLIKLLLVGTVVALGALHHFALRPARYTLFARVVGGRLRFVSTLRLEVLAALLVLVAVGQLSATPVPVPASARQEIAAPTISKAANNITVTMTISPGGPGVNTVDVEVAQAARPLADAKVAVRFARPETDQRSEWLPADPVDAGLYVTSSAGIDAPGIWWALIDLTHNGQTQRFAGAVNITEAAAITTALPPQPRHGFALLLVMAALGWVSYPTAKRLALRLDLSPAAITVTLGATAATTLALLIGLLVLQRTQASAREALNPPPQIINPALPDAASLARGEAVYAAACQGWPAARDLPALRVSLPRLRDETLFAATRSGWRSVPGCAANLTDTQRWDLVNYIRTWENTPAENDQNPS